jgi:hypothetical protein
MTRHVDARQPVPALSGMAAALQKAEEDAAKAGLRSASSIARAQQWLRANKLHRFAHEIDLLRPLGRLLDQVEAAHDEPR